jgi:hypothetical protein
MEYNLATDEGEEWDEDYDDDDYEDYEDYDNEEWDLSEHLETLGEEVNLDGSPVTFQIDVNSINPFEDQFKDKNGFYN